jgi:GTPase SAR1 family protein
VGKSSFLHLVCNNEVAHNSQPTIGCRVFVKIHQRSNADKLNFIEFFEISGNPKHRPQARYPFYNNFNGIIFVYDLTDETSLSNIWTWNMEIQDCLNQKSANARAANTPVMMSATPSPVVLPSASSVCTAASAQWHSSSTTSSHQQISIRRSQSVSKGYKHRPTTQSFDFLEGDATTPISIRPIHPLTTHAVHPSRLSYTTPPSSSEEDNTNGYTSMLMPPILIVGCKSDLCNRIHSQHSVEPSSWRKDLRYFWTVVQHHTACIMRRVLFLPVPMKKLLRLGTNHVVCDGLINESIGFSNGTLKPVDLLSFFQTHWNATVLEMCTHKVQDEKLRMVDNFLEKVFDNIFSYNCKV